MFRDTGKSGGREEQQKIEQDDEQDPPQSPEPRQDLHTALNIQIVAGKQYDREDRDPETDLIEDAYLRRHSRGKLQDDDQEQDIPRYGQCGGQRMSAPKSRRP